MSVRVDSYLQMLIYNNLGVQTSIKSLILFPRNDVIANMKRYHNYGPLLWLVLIGPADEEGRLLGRFRSGGKLQFTNCPRVLLTEGLTEGVPGNLIGRRKESGLTFLP